MSRASATRLTRVLALILGYMGIEFVAGWLSGSLALVADAGHMASDAGALALALGAVLLAERPPTSRRTFGFLRAEVLAALANGVALTALAGWILWEAVERLLEPTHVAGGVMSLVAAGGLAVNLVALSLLSGGRGESLNVRGAWLHLLGDTLGSVAAVAAGLLVAWKGWAWADPLASALVAVFMLVSTWALVRDALSVLMEDTPRSLDLDRVRESLAAARGVVGVHDLHAWSISSRVVALSAHVDTDGTRPDREVLGELCGLLRDRFAIQHATLQLEPAPVAAAGGAAAGADICYAAAEGRVRCAALPARAAS